MIEADDLIGAWRLTSWEIDFEGLEQTVRPFGDRPIGWLLYSRDGAMSAQLMSRARPGLGGRSIRKLNPEERMDVLENFFAYAGRYRIDGDVIVHEVDVALNPDFVGQDQHREAVLEGDHLILRGSETDARGRQRRHCLIWQRLQGEY